MLSNIKHKWKKDNKQCLLDPPPPPPPKTGMVNKETKAIQDGDEQLFNQK